jgi:hygromycin-B 4-O-kinase
VLVRGTRITAIIDWGNALYGDWLYDPAWLISWWPWFPRWQGIDITAALVPSMVKRGRGGVLNIGSGAG